MLNAKAFFVTLIFGVISSIQFTLAQSLKSGFKALEIHDYFKAKKAFEKNKKRNASIASFGLAQLYMRPQNVFYNIDSAYVHIRTAVDNYDAVRPKIKKKYLPYGFEKSNLEFLRQEISTKIFERTLQTNTEEAFIEFINQHIWAKEIPRATFMRDSLAFEKHLAKGTSEEMAVFLNKYPTSVLSERAQMAFFQLQFEEETRSKRKEDYERFLKNFPENPFVKEADRALYRFAEELNTVTGYEKFINSYPKSAYKSEAWRALYRAYVKQNGLALINEFKKSYPNYPFLDELDLELSLLNTQLFPVFVENAWGYMDSKGIIKIAPKFDYAEFFSQGRAAAQKDDLYGFIDVVGNWIIRPQFSEVTPFRFNLSVVIDQEGKAGVINLFGEWVLESRFEDIQIINDDWLWVQDESGWILYQISKNKFGQEYFSEVGEFINGYAIVSKAGEHALIDLTGNRLLSFPEPIERFGDLFIVTWNDSTALINEFNDKYLPFNKYKFGNFNPNGFTPFELNGSLGYVNAEGKIIIPARLDVYNNWELFAGFTNRHAKAYQSKIKKYGLIDESGNWVIPARYNDISFFSDIIAVQSTEKWEYISKSSQRLNLGTFDRAESFVEGSGIVIRNGTYGLINFKGEELIPTRMKRIVRLSEQVIRWEDEENRLWLGNHLGQLLHDMPFDKIDRIDDNVIRMIGEEKVYYYLIKERQIVSLKQ
jgi:hypothetical protein